MPAALETTRRKGALDSMFIPPSAPAPAPAPPSVPSSSAPSSSLASASSKKVDELTASVLIGKNLGGDSNRNKNAFDKTNNKSIEATSSSHMLDEPVGIVPEKTISRSEKVIGGGRRISSGSTSLLHTPNQQRRRSESLRSSSELDPLNQ